VSFLFLLASEIASTILHTATMSTNIMRREKIGKEEGSLIPTTPLLAVRGHLCFRCLSHSANLFKCGGCKRATYCGKSCQKLDWKVQHKSHCRILQAANEAEAQDEAESRSCSEWKELLVSAKLTTAFIRAFFTNSYIYSCILSGAIYSTSNSTCVLRTDTFNSIPDYN